MPLSSFQKIWGNFVAPHTIAAPNTRVAPNYKFEDLNLSVEPDVTSTLFAEGGSWANTSQAIKTDRSKVAGKSETMGYNTLLALLHAVLVTDQADGATTLAGVTDGHVGTPAYTSTFFMRPFNPNLQRRFTVQTGIDNGFGNEATNVQFNKLSFSWTRESLSWTVEGSGGKYRTVGDGLDDAPNYPALAALTTAHTAVAKQTIPPDDFCFYLSTTSYADLIANGTDLMGRAGTGTARLDMLKSLDFSISERSMDWKPGRCDGSTEFVEDFALGVSFTHEYNTATAGWLDQIRSGSPFWLQIVSKGAQLNDTPTNAGFIIEMCLYMETHAAPSPTDKVIAVKYGDFKAAHDPTFVGGVDGFFQWLLTCSDQYPLGLT